MEPLLSLVRQPATLQVVINPPLRRGSVIHDRTTDRVHPCGLTVAAALKNVEGRQR